MKKLILILISLPILTSFASPFDSEKTTISSSEISNEKQCKIYKSEVRKFIRELLLHPIAMNAYPPFNFERVRQKPSGRDLLRFKYNFGKETNKQIRVGKIEKMGDPSRISINITPKDSKAFEHHLFYAIIEIQNMDYSNIKMVKDIYANPNGNGHLMKLKTSQGQVIIKPIWFGGNYSSNSPQPQNYDSWWMDCLE